MDLHRTDPAALDDDPFWSVVRRRHPEVPVVVLPAAGPPADVPDGAPPRRTSDPHEARRAAHRLVDTWRGIAEVLAEPGVAGTPAVRWAARDDGQALVLERSVAAPDEGAAMALLGRLAVRLGRNAWRLAATTRAGRPWLDAVADDLRLQAAVEAVGVRVALAGVALHLDPGERRNLRTAVVEEVRSWA